MFQASKNESWYVEENKPENCFFEQSWYVVYIQ